MATIPKHEIERIRDSRPISEIVGRYVEWDRAKSVPSRRDWWAPCPFHGEKTPSFHVDDRKGFFKCFGCGLSGDVFKFVQERESVSFQQAVRIVAGGQVETERDPEREREFRNQHRRRQERAERDKENREHSVRTIARRIWDSGKPISGTAAERYFRQRGIDIDVAAIRAFRFVVDLAYPDQFGGGSYPALVCAVQGPDRKFRGITRIYLTPDGRKAPVERVKVELGPIAGGAVWIGAPGPRVNICEGVETALGIRSLIQEREPVAACLGTTGLMRFEPPDGTKIVLIWPDGDRDRIQARRDGEHMLRSPGIEAARKAARALSGDVMASVQPTPRTGNDYLDIWNAAKAHLK